MGWPPRRADARCGRRGAVAARAPHRVGRHERRASRALRGDRRRVPLAHGARLQRLRLHRAARRRPRRPRRPPLPARKLPLARGCRQRARVRAHRQRHRRGHRRRLSGRPPRQPLVRHGRLELGRVLAGPHISPTSPPLSPHLPTPRTRASAGRLRATSATSSPPRPRRAARSTTCSRLSRHRISRNCLGPFSPLPCRCSRSRATGCCGAQRRPRRTTTSVRCGTGSSATRSASPARRTSGGSRPPFFFFLSALLLTGAATRAVSAPRVSPSWHPEPSCHRRAHELHLHAAARRRGAQGVGQVGLRLPLLLGDAV